MKDVPNFMHNLLMNVPNRILVRKVLVTGPFPGMGTGDPDLYKGFTWRFWSLISDGAGRMGVVLPRSVFSTKGASEFRKDVFSRGTVEDYDKPC